jgi:hypothetical protein
MTEEDENYDLTFTKSGHTSVIAAGKTAALAALSEYINVGVPA